MTNREVLMETLRKATNGDRWLTRYALVKLCEESDWQTLINVVDDVLQAAEGRDDVPEHLRLLLAERWAPTSRFD